MHVIAIMVWMQGNECIELYLWNECMEMDAWNCNYGLEWMELNVFHWKLCKVCNFKFDCEWGNGMGPQGLGMVPWEFPSGLLTPTVPWVQWYWTFTGLRGN